MDKILLFVPILFFSHSKNRKNITEITSFYLQFAQAEKTLPYPSHLYKTSTLSHCDFFKPFRTTFVFWQSTGKWI